MINAQIVCEGTTLNEKKKSCVSIKCIQSSDLKLNTENVAWGLYVKLQIEYPF